MATHSEGTTILGRERHLARELTLRDIIALGVASSAPAAATFTTFGVAVASSGTGLFLAFLIGGVLMLCVAFVYAELGAAFPFAGGGFTMIERVFPRIVGVIFAFLYIVLYVVDVPSIAVGAGSYLNAVNSHIPIGLASFVIVLIFMAISMTRLKMAAWITIVMVGLEFIVLVGFILVSVGQFHQPMGILFHPRQITKTGLGAAVPFSGLMGTVAISLYTFGGFQSIVHYGQETVGVRKIVARGLIIGGLIAIVLDTIGMGTLLLVSPHIADAVTSSLPGAQVARSVLGTFGSVFLLGYIAVSNFNGGLSANLQAVRLFYNLGNVGIFPKRVSTWLMRLSQSQVPYLSALILAVPACVLALFYSLTTLITFTAVILGLVFIVIAIASLVSRYTQKAIDRPFRIPLWPLPPLVVIFGAGYAISTQQVSNLIIVAVIVVLGFLYYLAFERGKPEAKPMIDDTPAVPTPQR